MVRLLNATMGVAVIVLLAVLYNVRYDADAQIRAIRKAEQDIGLELVERSVMEAEWVSLNDPARLELLSGRYLKMQPLKASQLGSLESFTAEENAEEIETGYKGFVPVRLDVFEAKQWGGVYAQD